MNIFLPYHDFEGSPRHKRTDHPTTSPRKLAAQASFDLVEEGYSIELSNDKEYLNIIGVRPEQVTAALEIAGILPPGVLPASK